MDHPKKEEHREGEMRNSLVLGRWSDLSSVWFCMVLISFEDAMCLTAMGSMVPMGGGPRSIWILDQFFSFWLQFKSVQSLSCVRLFATPWTAARQASLWPARGVHPNPCPLSQWWHPTISSSAVPFSSHPQFFPASGSFQMSQLFTTGGQNIGASASTSVLPMNTQDWPPNSC